LTHSTSDPTIGLCLGPYAGPMGVAVSYERGTGGVPGKAERHSQISESSSRPADKLVQNKDISSQNWPFFHFLSVIIFHPLRKTLYACVMPRLPPSSRSLAYIDPSPCACPPSSQFENNYFTDMCSGSAAGSYLRLMDFVYHSTLGLRVIQKTLLRSEAVPSTLRIRTAKG